MPETLTGRTPDAELAGWLVDLVGEDKAARFAAAEAIGEAWLEAERESPGRYGAAVRAAVAGEGFPKAEFVRRLFLYRIAVADDWRRRCDRKPEKRARPCALDDPATRRDLAGGPEGERLVERYARLLDDPSTEGQDMFRVAEGLKPPAIQSFIVLDALDDALLADRGGLMAMLRHGPTFHEGAQALARIGPPAVDFAPFLLARLDEGGFRFDGPHALGAIGRDDPGTVDALLDRLRRGDDDRRAAVAATLAQAGPGLAGREAEAVRLLIDATEAPGWAAASATTALASVGRHREDALRRVRRLAGPGSGDEASVATRGAALAGLGRFVAFPDRAVPALIAAIDDFEEYDPDHGYGGGDHVRVCDALAAFGPAAAPAVPRVVALLDAYLSSVDRRKQLPEDALALLAAIGPAAAPALSRLERMRDELYDEPAGPLDPDDHLDRAILAIRGR